MAFQSARPWSSWQECLRAQWATRVVFLERRARSDAMLARVEFERGVLEFLEMVVKYDSA